MPSISLVTNNCQVFAIWREFGRKQLLKVMAVATQKTKKYFLQTCLPPTAPSPGNLATLAQVLPCGGVWLQVPCPPHRAREHCFQRTRHTEVALLSSEQTAESPGTKQSHLTALSCFCTTTSFSGHICLPQEDATVCSLPRTNSSHHQGSHRQQMPTSRSAFQERMMEIYVRSAGTYNANRAFMRLSRVLGNNILSSSRCYGNRLTAKIQLHSTNAQQKS